MSLLPSFLLAFRLIEMQIFPPGILAPTEALPKLYEGEKQTRDSDLPVSHGTQEVKSCNTPKKGKT